MRDGGAERQLNKDFVLVLYPTTIIQIERERKDSALKRERESEREPKGEDSAIKREIEGGERQSTKNLILILVIHPTSVIQSKREKERGFGIKERYRINWRYAWFSTSQA